VDDFYLAIFMVGDGGCWLLAHLHAFFSFLFVLAIDGRGQEHGFPTMYSYMLGRMTSQNKSYYSLLREPSAAYRVKKAKNTSKKDKRARKTLAFFLCLLAAA